MTRTLSREVFGKALPPPDEKSDAPPPFRWADVEARLSRITRQHDGATSAEIMWAPILRNLQAEQARMRSRGCL